MGTGRNPYPIHPGVFRMRIIYITVDGRAVVEKTKTTARILEMPDGYHPVTNDSVWQDSKRILEPMLLVIQGVRGPFGATMENEDVSSLLYEIELDERAFRKPRVSKMWMRSLERIFDFLQTKGLYIGVLGFALYFIAQAMLKGG